MASNGNGWDVDDHEDQFHVERRTAIEARLRAQFEAGSTPPSTTRGGR
jgi:hypothetical protein